MFSEAYHAGKFRVINLNFNPKEAYTLWCGADRIQLLTLASHGDGSLLVQRMFTCKNRRQRERCVVGCLAGADVSAPVSGGEGVCVLQACAADGAEQVVVNADSIGVCDLHRERDAAGVVGAADGGDFCDGDFDFDSLLAAAARRR